MFFVSASLWDHFISHFGEAHRIDYIPWFVCFLYPYSCSHAPSRSLAVRPFDRVVRRTILISVFSLLAHNCIHCEFSVEGL